MGGITDLLLGIARTVLGGYIAFHSLLYTIQNMYMIKNVDIDDQII
jgi:hypothetical protein